MRCFHPGLIFLAVATSGCVQAQTAPQVAFSNSDVGTLRVTTLLNNLQNPWGMALLPDGRLLITERPGRLRIYAKGVLSAPVAGVPTVWAQGQGGLLDVVADPDFVSNGRIYFSYAEVGSSGTGGTAVMRARLGAAGLSEQTVIFRQMPKLSTGNHFGSRLVFDREGHLFITLGENFNRMAAQAVNQHQGKMGRILPDGSVPADNPFAGRPDGAQ